MCAAANIQKPTAKALVWDSLSICLLVIIVLSAASCSRTPKIETNTVTVKNPTNFIYPVPLKEVRERAMQVFSIENQSERPIFGNKHGAGLESIFALECVTNAVFSSEVFTNPANVNDLFLHTFGMPFTASPVYHVADEQLPFIASFHIHLVPDGTSTVVTVSALDVQVLAGTKFGLGPCGFGKGNNNVPVKPTTIEEYSILKYLGSSLGITNMPPVILPKQKST